MAALYSVATQLEAKPLGRLRMKVVALWRISLTETVMSLLVSLNLTFLRRGCCGFGLPVTRGPASAHRRERVRAEVEPRLRTVTSPGSRRARRSEE